MSEATPEQVTSNAPLEAVSPTEPPKVPPRKVTLYLVRHGQTQYNIEHRLPGQLAGVSLTDEGRKQAQQLGESLTDMPLTTIVTSPLERALQTAEYVRGSRDIPLREEPRLMDTNVGRWAGQVISDLDKNEPEWLSFRRRPTHPPPGIEGFYEVLQRIIAVSEEVRHDESLGDAIMLVAHADVVKLLIAHYMRLPIEGVPWLHIANASVTTLTFMGDHGPTMEALNWTPSPAWLRPPLPKEESPQSATDVAPVSNP